MSKQSLRITCSAVERKAIIRIDGHISNWNNYALNFKSNLDELINRGVADADIYINTPGGDCFEASEITNEIKRFPGTLTAKLGALCASEGAYIASSCHRVIISRNTSYMIHKPAGVITGNSDDVKSYLKLLENIETVYLDTYAKKTGLPVNEIEKMWVNDYWMNSDECIEKGFADEREGEAEITDDDVNAMLLYNNAPQIAASLKRNTSRTGWTYSDYQEKDPIALAKLHENQPLLFDALYKAHYGHSSVKPSSKTQVRSTEDRTNWTYSDYQEKNPAALAEIHENQPELFDRLYKANYGYSFK